MNILFLTAYPPVLDMHGGGVRMYHNIRILGRRHRVHVVSYVESDEERDRLGKIGGICESVRAVVRAPGRAAGRRFRTPAQIRGFDLPEMRRAVEETRRRHAIDVVQCEYVEMALFHAADAFSVWTVTDLLSPGHRERFESATRPLERARWYRRWKSMARFETRAATRFDRVVAMTPDDAAHIRRRAPGADVRDIPIGVDSRRYAPLDPDPAAPLRVVFLGNHRHAPNLEAVVFIRDQLAPMLPSLRFEVAGRGLPNGMLDGSPVRDVGFQADTRGLYRRPNTIVVAPLFSGRGQRVKLLEAFAMGVPVVATTLAAAGFPVRDGKEARIAETADDFRSALAALGESRDLREDLGSNGRRMVLDRFEWDILADRFLEVVEPGPDFDGRGKGRWNRQPGSMS